MTLTRRMRDTFLWYKEDDFKYTRLRWRRRLGGLMNRVVSGFCRAFGHSTFRYPCSDPADRRKNYDPETVLCNRCNMYLNAVEMLVHPPTIRCRVLGCRMEADPRGYISHGVICVRCSRHSS